MAAIEELYCKVYIDADVANVNLLSLISIFLSGTIEGRTIYASTCETDIIDNEDLDAYNRTQLTDSFLYYRYYLDIFPNKDIRNRKVYVETISALLEYLWSCQFQAVAACDFEEELPRQGGYNSGNNFN